MEKFNIFLDHASETYENMVIGGDLNLSKISWDSLENTRGTKEVAFLEILNDHFLTQLNFIPTRRDRVLDLVITNVPDRVRMPKVLSPKESDVFTDHGTVSFEFHESTKATHRVKRTVYDYRNGDFDGLRGALEALNLCNLIQDSDDINSDWTFWKDAFMSAVSDFIPTKKIKGKNTPPWITSEIIHALRKKEAARSKLKKSPTDHQQQKYRELRAKAKSLIHESRETYFSSLDLDLVQQPKRFWSFFKLKNRMRSFPETMNSGDDTHQSSQASTPQQIAELFNSYFVSVFTAPSEVHSLSVPSTPSHPTLNELKIPVEMVLATLKQLDINKATGSDGIPVRLLKETANQIAPSLHYLTKRCNCKCSSQYYNLHNLLSKTIQLLI